MSKTDKRVRKMGGPYLAAAFFCETTIEDAKDHALSAIRIVDQVELAVDASLPTDFPSEDNRINMPAHALLAFRTGDAQGSHTVRCVMESPSGKRGTVLEQTVQFSPQPNGGANVRLNITLGVYKGGVFWLHVFLDGKPIAHMPLQVTIRRESLSRPVPGETQAPRG